MNKLFKTISKPFQLINSVGKGIEKTIKRDTNVKKIDVDLSKGKVLIAYDLSHEIIFDDIKEKILMNGQNAIDMRVIDL